jgi:hypothetical protein
MARAAAALLQIWKHRVALMTRLLKSRLLKLLLLLQDLPWSVLGTEKCSRP